jgi:hypothetical protein
MTRRGLLSSTSSFLLVVGMLGCGGEQRSGAAPADTTQTVPDTGAVAGGPTGAAQPSDTAPPPARDTAATRPDTTPARRDTASKAAARAAPRRTPKPRTSSAPQPRTDTVTAPDSGQTTAAAPAPADTAAAQPAETSATTPAPTTQATAQDPYHRAPLDTVAPQVYDGWKQYNLNCARCHGEDVLGTTIAPHLVVSLKPDGPINTKELFVQTVCAGRPAKGMPAWCSLGMEMPTIEAIYAYVKGRSDGKLRPGRPARKEGG